MRNRRILNELEKRDFIDDLIAKKFNPSDIYVKDMELLVGCNEEGGFDEVNISFLTYDENGKFDKDIHISFSLDHYYISIRDHYYTKDVAYLYTILGAHDAVFEGIKKICKAYTEDLHKKSFEDFLKMFFEAFYNSLNNVYEMNLEISEEDDPKGIEKITVITDEFEKLKFKKSVIRELFQIDLADAICKDDGSIDKLSDEFWADAIGKSLLDIYKKYEYAKKLELEKLEAECKIVVDSLKREYCEALYLKEININNEPEVISKRPFDYADEALNYVRKTICDNNTNNCNKNVSNKHTYYKLEKWLADIAYRDYYRHGKAESNMTLEYIYYIINGNIVYANKGIKVNENDDLKYISLPVMNSTIPI